MKTSYKKEKNYGIAILRVILSFMVVLDHFYNGPKKVSYLNILYYHIPTFFLISFYYTNNYFASFNIEKIKLRFERIIIPYICWSIIACFLNNIYYYILNKECSHTIYDFYHNILTGHIFFWALWFQNNLILTTLIISIVVFSFKKDYLLILQFLMILSYILQYSGENFRFFSQNFTIHYTVTYGRFLDNFPHSIFGFFIGTLKLVNRLKLNKLRAIITSVIILVFLSKYNFDNNLKCFKYGGIRLTIAATCIFFLFFLSFENIRNKKMFKLLDIITNYTPGIYFSHFLIGKGYIMNIILGNKISTINGCIILYLISYSLCFCLNKMIGNTKLKHLIK